MIFSIEDGRENFYQWDSNRRLIIHDENITEVHFCNKTDDCSLVSEVYPENGTRYANVPNVLLTMDWSIKVYAFDKYYTKHCETYKVIPRTKPADYAYEETEVMNWHTLEDKVDKLINDVGQAEVSRMSNEELREVHESERMYFESVRQDNETTREEAEMARREVFDEFVADIVKAQNDADIMLDTTREALANSEELLEDVRGTAELATSAATNAINATNKANAATSRADAATAKANEAANKANKAANGINGTFANALKGNKTDVGSIYIDDISPLTQYIDVSVRSKNLVDVSKPYILANGTYTETNGTVEIVRTHESKTPNVYIRVGKATDFVGKTLTFSFICVETNGTGAGGIDYYMGTHANSTFNRIAANSTKKVGERIYISGTMPTDVEGEFVIRFNCSNLAAVNEYVKLKEIQVEEGATATAYAPYIKDITDITVNKINKNLVNVDNAPMFGNYSPLYSSGWNYEKTYTGIRFNFTEAKEIKSFRSGYQVIPIDAIRGKKLTFSCKRYSEADDTNTSTVAIIYAADNELNDEYTYVASYLENYIQYRDISLKSMADKTKISYTFTVPADETRKYLFILMYAGYNGTMTGAGIVEYSDIQIEISNVATEYEHGIEKVNYTPNADGTINNVSILYPTVLYSETAGVILEANYNRDINKAFAELQQAIISLGGNV